ncbi:MAG: HAD-IA family hydrolase [Patescibacteria group bacterium]
MKFKNIIFDFDGTLVDSKPGIVTSFKLVAKDFKKEVSEDQITKLIGLPLAEFLATMLSTNNQETISKGSGLFIKYYAEKGIKLNTVYSGIEQLLAFLKNHGYQIFIVSNRIELFLKEIIKLHNLEKYFIFVRGTDGTDKKSEKAEYVKDVIKKYKLKKEETAIIGDTENDIIAGKNNSIYSIGVTWGYRTKDDLIKAGADMVFNTPLELQQYIKNENRETN